MELIKSNDDMKLTTAQQGRQDEPEVRLKQSKKRLKMSQPQVNGGRDQLSSFLVFFIIVLLFNLCPYQSDNTNRNGKQPDLTTSRLVAPVTTRTSYIHELAEYLNGLNGCLEFVKLMFSNPMRLNERATRVTLAEAKVLSKMAKVWYIKKKIKKLGKKLKKHTIAVPVFTAIPVHDPMSHIGQVEHVGAIQHAASAYAPLIADQMTVAAALAAAQHQHQQQQSQNQPNKQGQQLMTSASSHQQMAVYQRAPSHRRRPGPYAGHHAPTANRIINAYMPAPPLFVDETGGIYGTYGNAYGRYDGGYHFW